MLIDLDQPKLAALFLRAHLKMLDLGMKNSRLSGAQILAKASEVTGQHYKRGQYQKAIDDLNVIIKGECAPEPIRIKLEGRIGGWQD